MFIPTKASSRERGRQRNPDSKNCQLAEQYPFAGAEGLTNVVRDATITGKPYPIKGWIVAGTNLMKTLPNQKETLDAIKSSTFLSLLMSCPLTR